MMGDQNSQVSGSSRRWRRARALFDPWQGVAVIVAVLVLAPVASVVWMAFNPAENIWPHLMATVMPRYLANTLILMLGVGVMTAAIGTGAAWMVTMYRFPGSRWLDYALLFPLAIPAYVGAYALVDFLDFAGPLQTAMRAAMGWQSARDYWFFEVRAQGPAIIVFSAALYPYVYLLARAAFREQSGCTYEVARALGTGQGALFWRLGLPLARPAIAVGVTLALMETVADYGTVHHFGVQTLTTGIFSTWLDGNNAGGAAQIAMVSLTLILILVTLERLGRRRARFHRLGRVARPLEPARLAGPRAWAMTALCLVPFTMGFVLPVGVMVYQAMRSPEAWLAPGLQAALANTLMVAGGASIVTVGAAILFVYALRLARPGLAQAVLPVTAVGYATPGAVLAVGLLVPLAALDNRLADWVLAWTGRDPGLMITGTAVAVGLAYMVRFFAVAQGAVDAAFGRVTPTLPMVARSLGQDRAGALGSVYLPLMRGSVATALLVVFVDGVKELPATLLLRPFNFNTLSTRVYELVSLERLSEAAPAALLVMGVGLAAVALLARASR